MRFIGNKEKLLNNIYDTSTNFSGLKEGTFFDFFSGTGNVGKFFKEKGFQIISSDLLYFSFILQKAYIVNNKKPTFSKLIDKIPQEKDRLFSDPLDIVLDYLNSLKGMNGFIYKNYTEEGTKNNEFTRKYFIGANGKKIDAIRKKIEYWKKENLINNNEYYILLACLIESVPYYANISGVYAAFLKGYDPRSIKNFSIRPIKIIKSNKKHRVYNCDSVKLLNKNNVDILYLDPPYNNRQYGGNYHILETIAKYDNPKIRGVTGMRNYSEQKSDFCNKFSALKQLDYIASTKNYKFLILSYNSEGIMKKSEINNVLKKYGKTDLIEIDYLRFKSNNNGSSKNKKHIKEQLYLLKRL